MKLPVAKKGETIIEVVVAMSILALIMVGVYTVVLGVTNVAVASRSRTEATYLGQRVLNEYMRLNTDSCIPTFTPVFDEPAGCTPADPNNPPATPCAYISKIEDLNADANVTPREIDSFNVLPAPENSFVDSFVKITSNVVWKDLKTGQNNKIEISLIARKK